MLTVIKKGSMTMAMASVLSTLLALSAVTNSCHAFIPPGMGATQRSGKTSIGGRTSLGALAVDLSTAITSIDHYYQTAPALQSAFLTCGVKASVADAVAQRMDDDAESVDKDTMGSVSAAAATDDDTNSFSPLRNLAFVLYGGLYTGCAQEIIYNSIFPRIFGTGNAPLTILSEVAVDSFVVGPLLCLPIAYFIKALVFNYSPKEGLRRYAEDIQLKGLLTKYWALWVPVQSLTFSVIPEHLRIVFVAMVSFFWFIVLSVVSDNEGAANQEG